MEMTMDQITAAYPSVAKLESQAGRELLAAMMEQMQALAAENVGLKSVLEYVINPDNQPEYHDQGMGCGVEDHGYQRNGYSACAYGWESAMERVYSEVIPDVMPETPATDRLLADVKAQGVDAAIEHLHKKFAGTGNIGVPVMALEWFAQQLRGEKAE